MTSPPSGSMKANGLLWQAARMLGIGHKES
jgi:hypothetical protein